ncbi:DNA polymerase III subunit beta [Candidatus Dojkabacteria bacterium]|nr:DNA polymerase III subunit beta [Candidatus Dojkabacteria bacterium]
MKITCNQTSLAKQLAIVGRLVSSKPGLPILANVLLKTEDSKVIMTATDLEIGVHTWLGAEIKAEGVITIPARTFSEFVNSLPVGNVELTLDKQLLKVETVNNSAQFNTLPADDFPTVPGINDGNLLMSIPSRDFQTAVKRVAVAAATDDSRPVLTGINIEAEGKGVTFVAIDGFRLSTQYIELDKEVKNKTTILVPAKALLEVSKIVADLADPEEKEDKNDVSVYLLNDKNQVIFRYKEVDLISRLIDGQFPEYKHIIPTGNEIKCDMDLAKLQNAVKIVNIFARGTIGSKAIMNFDVENSSIKVSASLAEIGENESSFETKIEGNPLKIGFSTKFLNDMISTFDSDTIIFEGSNPTAPGVFKSKNDDSYLHIIMPMRAN